MLKLNVGMLILHEAIMQCITEIFIKQLWGMDGFNWEFAAATGKAGEPLVWDRNFSLLKQNCKEQNYISTRDFYDFGVYGWFGQVH